jgi:hypothetical protein
MREVLISDNKPRKVAYLINQTHLIFFLAYSSEGSYREKKGEIVLQEDPFFSAPFTFFGPHHVNEDEIENAEEDLLISEIWRHSLPLQGNFADYKPTKIGLFLHWYELEE